MVEKVEKLAENLFRIKIPLPRNPLKYTNSYVIVGDRALVIDTGFNMDVCYAEMLSGLRAIGVEPGKVDVFMTHIHADHSGLAGKIGSRKYMSEIDAKILLESFNVDYWMEIIEIFQRHNFPEKFIKKLLNFHPAVKYEPYKFEPETLKEGEVLEYGDFQLKVILTPGHTPGHACLYDEERKILFSGDHILFDITPNITWWMLLEDSLESYLNSLRKVYELDVDRTFPGHREFRGSHRKRIEEIQRHHEKRLQEVLEAVRRGYRTAWEVAPHVTWDLKYDRWEDVALQQKFFAVGETIAHLIHLERRGKLKRIEGDLVEFLPVQ